MQKFEDIWKDYHHKLYSFVNKRVSDPAIAEDLLQDILIKVSAKIETLENTKKLQGWIYQIARNTIIDYYRSNKNLESELIGDLIAPETDQINQARQEVSLCLTSLIRHLPDKYRETMTLSEIEGITQKEIAIRQGISLSGAKSRVQRGRKLLKELLVACCVFELDQQQRMIDYHPKGDCSC